MKRVAVEPRKGWEETVAAQGLPYAVVDGQPYWDESAAYEFTAAEVDVLEAATNELHRRCLAAAESVIARGWWDRLGIPAAAIPLIQASWDADAPSLYGRFDLAYDGKGPPQLLEYNADTPTALVEAAVVQWYWLEDQFPGADQFNSLHEKLIGAWRHYSDQTAAETIHLSALRESLEDNQTILYLEDTLRSAKLEGKRLAVEDIGWDGVRFVDWEARPIEHLFKLYPWEWLLAEEFGAQVASAATRWIEPAWKLLLSNKAILPILWELNPDHPNLLPAYFEPGPLGGTAVRKPYFSREGANIQRIVGGRTEAETPGPYDEGKFIYQALAPIPNFEGQHPVLGSWVVNHEAAGIGIREDRALISTNQSRFVPHYFR